MFLSNLIDKMVTKLVSANSENQNVSITFCPDRDAPRCVHHAGHRRVGRRAQAQRWAGHTASKSDEKQIYSFFASCNICLVYWLHCVTTSENMD